MADDKRSMTNPNAMRSVSVIIPVKYPREEQCGVGEVRRNPPLKARKAAKAASKVRDRIMSILRVVVIKLKNMFLRTQICERCGRDLRDVPVEGFHDSRHFGLKTRVSHGGV